jgi:uncharacterized protein (DUF111 family)
MDKEYVVRLDPQAAARLDAARVKFGVGTMDQFILRALALAERQADLIQADGSINVINGDADDTSAEVVGLMVRHSSVTSAVPVPA